jgi:hypothetical protein
MGFKGVKVSKLESEFDSLECDLRLCDEDKLHAGYYHIVFAHPESFISCKYGWDLLQSQVYQRNVVAILMKPIAFWNG